MGEERVRRGGVLRVLAQPHQRRLRVAHGARARRVLRAVRRGVRVQRRARHVAADRVNGTATNGSTKISICSI